MIRRPTCAGRLNATEPKFSQIEGCNEGVDHANRIVIRNPVVQAFRQQSRLPAISSLNKTSHASPRRFSAGIIAGTAFSHSQGREPPCGPSEVGRTNIYLEQFAHGLFTHSAASSEKSVSHRAWYEQPTWLSAMHELIYPDCGIRSARL